MGARPPGPLKEPLGEQSEPPGPSSATELLAERHNAAEEMASREQWINNQRNRHRQIKQTRDNIPEYNDGSSSSPLLSPYHKMDMRSKKSVVFKTICEDLTKDTVTANWLGNFKLYELLNQKHTKYFDLLYQDYLECVRFIHLIKYEHTHGDTVHGTYYMNESDTFQIHNKGKTGLGYSLSHFNGLAGLANDCPVFVNFAADTLGGGYDNDFRGFVQEEKITFMSSMYIYLKGGGSVSNLTSEPRMFRTKQLFEIVEPDTYRYPMPYYGSLGFLELADDYRNKMIRETGRALPNPGDCIIGASTGPLNGHFDWLCMSANKLQTAMPESVIGQCLFIMLRTATKAFYHAANEKRKLQNTEKCEVYIATGNWGAGDFKHYSPVIAKLQIVAALIASDMLNKYMEDKSKPMKIKINLCYYPYDDDSVTRIIEDPIEGIAEWENRKPDECINIWAKQTKNHLQNLEDADRGAPAHLRGTA